MMEHDDKHAYQDKLRQLTDMQAEEGMKVLARLVRDYNHELRLLGVEDMVRPMLVHGFQDHILICLRHDNGVE